MFGDETKAAIERFQRDAGAPSVDGVVGPETMGLLDTHDVARPGGRPPATTGPRALPVAATDCDRHFTGVTAPSRSPIRPRPAWRTRRPWP